MAGDVHLIVLAAGRGTRLGLRSADLPKCLVEVGSHALLDWQLHAARQAGLEPVVVTGHAAERLRGRAPITVHNERYATTNMVVTLACARPWWGNGFVMAYGDIAYRPDVLRAAVAGEAPVNVVVDSAWRGYWEARFDDPLADAESLRLDAGGSIISIGQPVGHVDEVDAQYIGLVAFRSDGVRALERAYAAAETAAAKGSPPFGGARAYEELYMTDLLQALIDTGTQVAAVPVNRGWVEIDSEIDLRVAQDYAREGGLGPPPGAERKQRTW